MAESVFGKPIDTAIPEIITNANGVAYKFPNGLMICEKNLTIQDVACNNPWGNMYESQKLDFGNWAVAFTGIPQVSATIVGGMGGWLEYVTDTTSTVIGSGYFVRPNTNTASVAIDFIGIGLWK